MTEENRVFKADTTIHSEEKKPFVADEYLQVKKPVYVKAGDDMSDKGYEEAYLGDAIRFKMKRDNKRFWAGDNISEYVSETDKEINPSSNYEFVPTNHCIHFRQLKAPA